MPAILSQAESLGREAQSAIGEPSPKALPDRWNGRASGSASERVWIALKPPAPRLWGSASATKSSQPISLSWQTCWTRCVWHHAFAAASQSHPCGDTARRFRSVQGRRHYPSPIPNARLRFAGSATGCGSRAARISPDPERRRANRSRAFSMSRNVGLRMPPSTKPQISAPGAECGLRLRIRCR